MYMKNDFTIPVTNQSTGIQELTFDEVQMVDGAGLFLLAAPYIGKAIGYGLASAAGIATGVAITKGATELAKLVK